MTYPKRDQRPFKLQEYDPAWKERYAAAEAQIRPILGSNLISIEHIGSTAIEGMVAKPQIDILAVVKDLSKVPDVYQAFRDIGFTPKGRGYVEDDDEYICEDSPDGHRLTSVHVIQEGNPKVFGYRAFRDYLQTHDNERQHYISLKRQLSEKYADDYQEYNGRKAELIDDLKKRAVAWANKKAGQ